MEEGQRDEKSASPPSKQDMSGSVPRDTEKSARTRQGASVSCTSLGTLTDVNTGRDLLGRHPSTRLCTEPPQACERSQPYRRSRRKSLASSTRRCAPVLSAILPQESQCSFRPPRYPSLYVTVFIYGRALDIGVVPPVGFPYHSMSPHER